MLNQLINVFWTVISFGVTGHYWGQYFSEHQSLDLVIFFVMISVAVYQLPSKWLDSFTLSTDRRFYEAIGIKLIRWFVQDGTLVSRIQQKLGQRYKTITNRKTGQAYLTKIGVQERFHYACFVFFALTAVSAMAGGELKMGFLICFSNIIYNVCPILLQQYNRLRIRKLVANAEIDHS